jgi:hypothetical protein
MPPRILASPWSSGYRPGYSKSFVPVTKANWHQVKAICTKELIAE